MVTPWKGRLRPFMQLSNTDSHSAAALLLVGEGS